MFCAARARVGRLELAHEPQVFLALEQSARVRLEVRRDDDLAENLAQVARDRFGQRAVEDDDAAERCLFIGGERLVPRLAQIRVGADAARDWCA